MSLIFESRTKGKAIMTLNQIRFINKILQARRRENIVIQRETTLEWEFHDSIDLIHAINTAVKNY